MSGDVEDFLRKLIEKQMGQKQRPAPQRPVAQVRPAPQPLRRPPPRMLEPEIVDVVEIVDAEPASGAGVSRHVNQHMDTSEYQARTGRLGAGVRAEEAALQSHLKETFGSGPKGQLAKSSTVASDSTSVNGGAAPTTAAAAAQASSGPTIANQIISMINSPNDLRRAFILGEVLRRPSFDDV